MVNSSSPLNTPPSPGYSIDQILRTTQSVSKPSGFRRVLGGIVGGVGNMFAPGIGSMIGSAISGGLGGLGGVSGLAGLPGLDSAGMMSDAMQYLDLQREMNQAQVAFETASAVMKARHDAAMAAVHNIQ